MSRKELIAMIARRDNISLEEAQEAVEECAEEIATLLEDPHYHNPAELYELAVDILANDLGIEPDYLDVILEVG